jgi:hypothetical protein
VGLFQMRVAIWNGGDYAGYPDDPKRQLDWFLDHAEAVKRQRLANGRPMGESSYGEWVADVERPAEQFRGRYQLRLEQARDLLRHAGDGDGVTAEVTGQLVDAGAAGPRALSALAAAQQQIGVNYRWGGESPSTGFDCSGLVQWAYAKAGIHIPRVTDEQFAASNGKPVGRDDLLPGDLVFFRDSTGYVHHVGMSLGDDRFVGAPHTGAKVRIDSLKDAYWAKEYAGARRFDGAAEASRSQAQILPAISRPRG